MKGPDPIPLKKKIKPIPASAKSENRVRCQLGRQQRICFLRRMFLVSSSLTIGWPPHFLPVATVLPRPPVFGGTNEDLTEKAGDNVCQGRLVGYNLGIFTAQHPAVGIVTSSRSYCVHVTPRPFSNYTVFLRRARALPVTPS